VRYFCVCRGVGKVPSGKKYRLGREFIKPGKV